ncbi:RNA-directed DNA polymerase [Thermoflavimicrobium dichotomicum]|uniref:Reverse transcriptase (RNA-dependent DNA polymerase) n=1 Tax=Thermoflavimicrobium dichotomicum TaxID=46223 RepID=A0A1I3LGM4_9BACL|nr:RNA-directed DNA polymerase [Thermoflavimicrobium dichotomicum]SFI83565.1 Reverse transcriptase (RNA-dependent DNA polymerase) [Thermoflavimicrobium dichotomicum]
MDLFERLMRWGYFPRELPPVFSTETLAGCLSKISLKFTVKPSKSITFSVPKQKHYRRTVSIPHPLHQLLLAKEISNHWSTLSAFFQRSNLSLSYPVIDSSDQRAVERAENFQSVQEKRFIRSTASRVVLFTDISRFYSTIYTHVIPWALHTKEIGKKKRRDRQLLGNRLDFCVRNTQEGQTLGIPIGPDTSLVIAEVIACAIDERLQEKMPELCGLRYVDDFYLYFDSMGQAEKALTMIQELLAEYELEINPHKTQIVYLPEMIFEPWKLELDLYQVRSDSVQSQRMDLFNLFHKAIAWYQKVKKPAIMKYALKKSVPTHMHPANWEIYESWLLRTLLDEPGVYPVVTHLFSYFRRRKMPLDLDRICQTLIQSITGHLRYNHDYEVAWALWLAKCLGIQLPSPIGQSLSSIKNSMVALLSLDLFHSGLLSGVEKTYWEQMVKQNGSFGEEWLLSYEAVKKEWISGELDHPFFQELAKHQVHFYNEWAQMSPVAMAHATTIGYES